LEGITQLVKTIDRIKENLNPALSIRGILLTMFDKRNKLSSEVDRTHAYEAGKKAVQYAMKGLNGVMPVIKRKGSSPYKWEIVPAPLTKIANVEKKLPSGFISSDGFGMTNKAKKYFKPLIGGKSQAMKNTNYQAGKMEMVPKKLKAWR